MRRRRILCAAHPQRTVIGLGESAVVSQLVARVSLSRRRHSANRQGTSSLLWGFDNASSMYRVLITGLRTIQLVGTPVDVEHWPKPSQVVELLGTSVNLANDAFVAAAVGVAATVDQYDPGTQVITLRADLPSPVLGTAIPADPAAFPRRFLRVWQAQFSHDETRPTDLVCIGGSSTGISIEVNGVGAPGDHWLIGVRPSSPHALLPERLRQFQRPDGPNRWATPLAWIAWSGVGNTSVHDCRRHFDSLVDLTSGGCDLTVSPGDNVQQIVTDRIRWNNAHSITSLHLRFTQGLFELRSPLVLDGLKVGDLTLSGCGTRVLAARQKAAVQLQNWNSASVFDISVETTVPAMGS